MRDGRPPWALELEAAVLSQTKPLFHSFWGHLVSRLSFFCMSAPVCQMPRAGEEGGTPPMPYFKGISKKIQIPLIIKFVICSL